jgi:hypothetical protein
MRQEITDSLFFIARKTGITQILNDEDSKVRKVMQRHEPATLPQGK